MVFGLVVISFINKRQDALSKMYHGSRKGVGRMYRIGILEKDETYLNMESDYGIEVENVTEDDETYRVYHIREEIIDKPAVKMLTGNRIKGIPQIMYQEGRLRFRITGMRNLYELIQENNSPSGKRQLLKIFRSILKIALSLEKYMLSADKLMMNPKEIYVDESNDEVVVPYIPFQSEEENDSAQFLEKVKQLCDILLEGIVSTEVCGSTEALDEQEEPAKESAEQTKEPEETDKKEIVAYLVRKRTHEKIRINRNVFKIGKDASCVDYCVEDNPTVSRNHADIVRKSDSYYLIDKGSLNHTFINGKKLEAGKFRKLANGCLLQLSDEVFEFVLKTE